MRYSVLLLILALTACTSGLPEAQRTISSTAQDAPFPQLVPLEGLLAKANRGSTIEADTRTLEARAAQLRRKAAALRGRSVIDGASRLRLLQAARNNTRRIRG